MQHEFAFGDGPAARPASSALRRVASPRPKSAKPSQAQQIFKRLKARIPTLRRRIAKSEAFWEDATQICAREFVPLQAKILEARKELTRKLSRWLTDPKYRNKKSQRRLKDVLLEELNRIAATQDTLDDDLAELFTQLRGMPLAAAREEDFQAECDFMTAMSEAAGLDVDFTQLRPDMTPDEVADYLNRAANGDPASAKARPSAQPKKPSKRQQAEEIKRRDAEAARLKDITTLYRQLAKLLHPDLEPNAARRQDKDAAMRELTIAYRNHDLEAMLRLEWEWVDQEQIGAGLIPEQKLRHYNHVLDEQIHALEIALARVPYAPRFGLAQPFTSLLFSGETVFREAEVRRTLTSRRRSLEALIQGVDQPGAIENRQAILRAAEIELACF